MTKWYYAYKVSLLCCCLALTIGAISSVFAQGVPAFEVDAISVRSDASLLQSRLDLYTRIPYSNLTFINTAGGFKATYEITADVFSLDRRNRRQHLVQTSIWESSPTVDFYAQTQAPQQYDPTTHTLHLAPGRYLLELQLTDKHSGEAYVHELPVEVRNLRSALAISDLLLLEDYDAQTQTMYPLVFDRVKSDDLHFTVFYEIYADRPQKVRVTREVVSMSKQGSGLIRWGKKILGLSAPEQEERAVQYTDAEVLTLVRGRHQIISDIPVADLNGEYYVRVKLEDENGRVLDAVERIFSAQWSGLSDHIANLDKAIEQLEYIAKDKDLKVIKNAPTYAERLERFEAFWEKRDPTPRTLRNESMEQYYYRVSYANSKYTSGTEGWKTDRGVVLVRYGLPDHIQRRNYNYANEPYEVWVYEQNGLRFIFVDKTGFGDFKLLQNYRPELRR